MLEAKFKEALKNLANIEADVYGKAIAEAKEKGDFVVQVLIEKFPNKSKQIVTAYSQAFRIEIADLEKMDIQSNIIKLVDRDVARKFKIIPLDRAGNNIIVATLNPHDLKLIDQIRFKTGYTAKAVFASKKAIEDALIKYYKMKDVGISNLKSTGDKAKQVVRDVIVEQVDDPIVKLVNQVLLQCVQRGASDIHIEPYETFVRIRLRIDGSLVEIARPPLGYKNQLISRVKIMAKLDIAEKRKPQDGAIQSSIDNKPIDFRVNSLPTVHGEKIVLRILDKSSLQVDMTKLGFDPEDFRRFRHSIHQPFGMVLVTGPTGSGKTTTLYSALQELNKVTENIMTAEDPVEFNLEGINQVHIDEKIDLTFASALKAFLRQDPDIIMVGEIRDKTTGEIAIKAALTGHLVLSTLHTNTAADTITRLLDMGLEPFNLISSLNAVIAQRLVRRLCAKCKVPDTKTQPDALLQLGLPERYAKQGKFYMAQGCDYCSQSGYRGRTAVHEVLIISDPIRQAIMRGAPALELKKIAQSEGMCTLRQNAIRKLIKGETDSIEVVKNTSTDSDNAHKVA